MQRDIGLEREISSRTYRDSKVPTPLQKTVENTCANLRNLLLFDDIGRRKVDALQFLPQKWHRIYRPRRTQIPLSVVGTRGRVVAR